MYCANASRIPGANVMLASQALALHSADADDVDDVSVHIHCQVPDQNFHYLNLVLLHNIDYQTLHYPMVVSFPTHIAPSRDQDTMNVADNLFQSHEMNCKKNLSNSYDDDDDVHHLPGS
jgi:hypothetical protein